MQSYPHLRSELAATAMALVDEYSDLPAGSVLRNFARSVRFARLVETSSEELPQQAANITRIVLGGREVVAHEMPWGA